MEILNIEISNLLNKNEKIYYYNRWFYANKLRETNPLEGNKLLEEVTISDFKIILLIFDRIILSIGHILCLLHEKEIDSLYKLFNNYFVLRLIENGWIVFSIWNTNELLSPDYFIEVNKEYLVASGWSLKADKFTLVPDFPIKHSKKLYVYKRLVGKQSRDFKNFYIEALEFLHVNKQLEVDKEKLKEIEKAIENGEWAIKTTDADIPFSMEKFWYDIKVKEEFKYWNKEEIKLALDLAKSSYYKAGETGNGRFIFLPLDLNDEVVINRSTYNEEIYAFLVSPWFLQKLLIHILGINNVILENISFEKLFLLRQSECFKKFQNFLICILKQTSKLIKSGNYLNLAFLKPELNVTDILNDLILQIQNYIIQRKRKERKFFKLLLSIINVLLKLATNRDFSSIKDLLESIISEEIILQCHDGNNIHELNSECFKHIKEILEINDKELSKRFNIPKIDFD